MTLLILDLGTQYFDIIMSYVSRQWKVLQSFCEKSGAFLSSAQKCKSTLKHYSSYYNLDLSVRLSVYYLLRRLWTDCHQTPHEGQGWSNLEPYDFGFHGNRLLHGSGVKIRHF